MNSTPHTWKEARRLQAWHLKQQGWLQRQIAEALGVISQGAVSQWMKRGREGGPEALRRRPPRGAPRRLSADQLARLPELLHRGPIAHGFRGELWTRTRIATIIRLEFGVSYHPRRVGRLLDALHWSPPKPTRRARQRDEAAIAQWCDETWPAIKKGRRPSSKRSSS
jgi:transposase